MKDAGASSGIGYVRKSSGGLVQFYGLRPIWSLSFSETSPLGSVTASPSGHLCVVQSFPDSTHVALDVDRNGEFVRALGPYPSFHRSERVVVESWGSVAMPISFDRGDDRVSAVLYGRDGEFSSQR